MATYNLSFSDNSGTTDGSYSYLHGRAVTETSGTTDALSFVKSNAAEFGSISDNSGSTDGAFSQVTGKSSVDSSGSTDTLAYVKATAAKKATVSDNSGTTDSGQTSSVNIVDSFSDSSGVVDGSPLKSNSGKFTDSSGSTDGIGFVKSGPRAISDVSGATDQIRVKRVRVITDISGGSDSIGSVEASNPVSDSEGWVILHFINPAGIAGNVTVAGTAQVGQVVLYPDAKSASDVKEVYDAYIGVPKLSVTSSSSLTITEPATAAAIIAADWAISASG